MSNKNDNFDDFDSLNVSVTTSFTYAAVFPIILFSLALLGFAYRFFQTRSRYYLALILACVLFTASSVAYLLMVRQPLNIASMLRPLAIIMVLSSCGNLIVLATMMQSVRALAYSLSDYLRAYMTTTVIMVVGLFVSVGTMAWGIGLSIQALLSWPSLGFMGKVMSSNIVMVYHYAANAIITTILLAVVVWMYLKVRHEPGLEAKRTQLFLVGLLCFTGSVRVYSSEYLAFSASIAWFVIALWPNTFVGLSDKPEGPGIAKDVQYKEQV